jgi:putative ABC transport system permease protein
MRELRSALRSLLRRPGFTATIVLTLGLAVGVNTVIFSVVNAVLLRPLPYPEPDRLVRIDTQYFSFKQERNAVSRPEYLELRRDARSFQSLAAWSDGTSTFGDLARPVREGCAKRLGWAARGRIVSKGWRERGSCYGGAHALA